MEAALIAKLLEIFGPSAIGLIDALIAKIEAKGTVSSVEWAALTSDVRRTGKDRMAAMLEKAGIALDSPQGMALLAAAA